MTDRITDSALYRHLWGTDEARAVLGEEGRLRRLAGGDHGAGPGPGRGRADPGPRGRTDRRARPGRPDRPGLRGRADPAGLALHAGPDPGPAGRAARAGPRLRLRRGHRAGHHRHLDGAGAAPDRRPGLAGPAADRGAAARARGRAPGHGDGGPHPRAAGQPGDVRLEGRVVGRRDPPPPGPAARRRAPLAGRAARRRQRAAWCSTGTRAWPCGPGSAPSSAWPTPASPG